MGALARADVPSFCVGFAAAMLVVYALAPAPRPVCRRKHAVTIEGSGSGSSSGAEPEPKCCDSSKPPLA